MNHLLKHIRRNILRTWNNDFGFGVTEVFGIGVEDNTVEYLSFLFDVFAGVVHAFMTGLNKLQHTTCN